MNKKMIIATLLLFIIISIGSVSASENITDDSPVLQDTEDTHIDTDVTDDDTAKSIEKDDEPIVGLDDPIDVDNTMGNEAIQEKLNTLKDNGVVNFKKGEYNNVKLIITNQTPNTRLKNIIINGNGATLKGTLNVTNGTTYENCYNGIFEIQNVDKFTLTGFNFIVTVNGTVKKDAMRNTPSCVIIFNTNNGTIENNSFSGGRFGLYVGNKFDMKIKNNDTLIKNNTVTNTIDMGIISFASPRSKIINNKVINSENHGIDVRNWNGPNCLVQGNTVIGAKEGIYLMHSSGHNATDNTLNNCNIGITCYGSTNIFANKNKFTNKTEIGYLLSEKYANITIGKNNEYKGLTFVNSNNMPPTPMKAIVPSSHDYQNQSGVFTYKYETDIEAVDDLTMNAKESKTLSVILTDDSTAKTMKNKKLEVYDNGKITTITTDDNGVAKITLNYENAGVYYCVLSFIGDYDHESIRKTVTVTVNGEVTPQTTATVIEASDLTVTTKKSKTLILTIKDNAGKVIANKQVKVSINGKESTVSTDANGVANINVDSVNAGVYYYALYFAGDDSYKASFKAVKVTVNKQTTKATMSAKKYKAKKAKKMTFTLKDASGKAIAGKKITFTVKGKTYSAKTNAKGIATVTIKLTKKGKYTVSAKFAGDNTYKAISKTAKLTITK